MPKTHSYVVEHDYGFAPNPFWGICTLANCKPAIRQYAQIGDRVIGTGSAGAGLNGRLIYWMIIDKIIDFDEYWSDLEYSIKKPTLTGSKIQHFGDNIYHKDAQGIFLQSDSFHSEPGGVLSENNLYIDTGRTERVLIGNQFSYLGKSAVAFPEELSMFVKKGPGHKSSFSQEELGMLDIWLHSVAPQGILGDPVRW